MSDFLLFTFLNLNLSSSERPNQLKLSSVEPRSFGQIHRSFGRSFGRISGQKWLKGWQILSKIRYLEERTLLAIEHQINLRQFDLGI